MREVLGLYFLGLERSKGNSLGQFIAAIIMERFDDRMSHEWATHVTDSTDPPDIDEMLDFLARIWPASHYSSRSIKLFSLYKKDVISSQT